MEFRYSTYIKAFLDFLEQAQHDHDCAQDFLKEQEALQQDILHKFELVDMSYHETARLGKLAAEARQERRRHKETMEATEPVTRFMSKNKGFIYQLKDLLGDVRKVEKKQKARTYRPRVMSPEDYYGEGEQHEDKREQCPDGGHGAEDGQQA